MAPLAEAFVRVRADTKDVKPDVERQFRDVGTSAGEEFAKGFSQDKSGRWRNAKGKFVKGMGGPEWRKQGEENSEEFVKPFQALGGQFSRSLSKQLGQAFKALPKLEVTADSSPADRAVADVRARLAELSGKTIGVDLDAGEALAEVGVLKRQLADIGKNATVEVRADVAAAIAELDAVKKEADAVDKTKRVKVDVDAGPALAGIRQISVALAAMAAIPAGAVLGGGIIALGGAFAAAGAGAAGLAAVAIPAFSRIHAAVQAANQAQAQSVQQGVAAQGQALAEAGAQAQLAQAVRQAAYAHAQALDQVRTATQQLAAAQVSAADAQRALTTARLAEQRSEEDAKNQIIDLQYSIEAQALAIQDARTQWQQAGLAATKAAAATASAQTAVNQALAEQAALNGNPGATADDRALAAAKVTAAQAALKAAQQAQAAQDEAVKKAHIAFEQAQQQLKEQQLQLSRLREDEKKTAKAGVDGSDQVRAARQRLAQANQSVANSERALAQARANVARTDQQSADQVAAAHRALAAAALAGARSSATLGSALAQLTPAEKALKGHWDELAGSFDKWQRSMEPTVLPVFGKGLDLIKGQIPSLTPLVKGAAGAFSGLLDDVGRAAHSPFFATFKSQIADLVPKAITGLGKSVGNVASGMLHIVSAILPYAPAILDFLQRATGKFAVWASGAGKSDWLKAIIAFIKQNGPSVGHTLAQVSGALVHVAQALAPLAGSAGVGALSTFRLLAVAVQGMPVGVIQALAVAFLAVRTAMLGYNAVSLLMASRTALMTGATIAFTIAQNGIKVATAAWTAVQWLLDAALDANPVGIVVVAIGALVGAVILAYNKVGWFRDLVNTVFNFIKEHWQLVLIAITGPLGLAVAVIIQYWDQISGAAKFAFDAIGTAVQFVWNNVLKPVWDFILSYIDLIIAGFQLEWTVVKAVWDAISGAVHLAWTKAIKPALDGLHYVLTSVIEPAWRSLRDAVKSAFGKVGDIVSSVWSNGVKPALDALSSTVAVIPDAFQTAVDAVGRIWHGLEQVAKAPVAFVINTVYNNGIARAWNVIADLVNLPELKPIKGFATGGVTPAGVLPGYTPGRDVHQIPTFAFSGGEAILRPELTRALGARWIHEGNKAASSGGVGGAAKFLLGAGDPGGVVQGFDGGGIIGDITNAVNKAGSWVVKQGSDVLRNGASALAHKILDPVLNQISHLGGNSTWAKAIFGMPQRMVDGFLGWIKGKVDPKIQASGAAGAVQAARREIGVPYSWGGGGLDGPSRGFAQGAGTVGFDCSSLVRYAWYQAVHKVMPRTSQEQMAWTKTVSSPQPGDLGFPHPGHVTMYSGNGHIIQAPHTGAYVEEVPAYAMQKWGRVAFDQGGTLPARSTGTWVNNTGHDEQVLTGPSASRIEQMLAASGGRGGPLVGEIHLHGIADQPSPKQITDALELAYNVHGDRW